MGTLNVIESVFLAALEQPNAEARATYLEQACAGDANLRRCVERLLDAHPRADGFMQAPAPGLPATVDHQPLTEKPGTVIGPYKLLQELGEGGFGVVFMAEQAEPVRRRVALKVIKPGMDSKQVVARFEAERQALALMDHPNIAKVLDGGATDSGRPYFVMELVKGVPITQFCDENRLTPRERLGLFVAVCEAIQHAHQKGIIHRDVKPSNVLVALCDGKPVPKVIDFGVAKAVGEPLTDKTLFTRHGQVIGTLEYMSPEQATLDQHDIDTRSDVYALGVLLYELLTGSTPIDKERLRSAAFAEMLRLIREEEPPRPSVRLSGSGLGLPLLAACRKTESQKLPGLVRGELDWIAMKALEKERARRYGTATAVAADVRRYLNDEPVEACPPSLGYRLGKLARKNRAALTLAGTAAGLLLLGSIVSGWQAWRATRAERAALDQRDVAEAQTRRAEDEAAAARAAREDLRKSQYGLVMTSIQSAANAGNFARVADLLQQQRPREGEEDRRGFEWHYWDGRLNRQLRTVPLRGGLGACLSGDGRRVAYWLHSAGGRPPTLEVAETATGRVLFSHTPKDAEKLLSGEGLSVSHDGARVAWRLWLGTGERSVVLVFDVDAGKPLFDRRGHRVQQLVLDRAGRRLVTIETAEAPDQWSPGRPQDYFVKLWDVAAPASELLHTWKVNAAQVYWPVISADGSRVAAASSLVPAGLGRTTTTAAPTTLHVWDAKGKRPLQAEVPFAVATLAFSPDGNRLAGAGDAPSQPAPRDEPRAAQTLLIDCAGEKLEVLRTTRVAGPLFGAGRYGFNVTYSPDGQLLAVWTGGIPGVRVLDATSGAAVRDIEAPLEPFDVTFSQDGTRLFTVGGRSLGSAYRVEGTAWQEWEVKPSKPAAPKKPAAPRAPPGHVVIWSRDGERQAVFRLSTIPRRSDGARAPLTISIRDRAGKEIHAFREHPDTGSANAWFSRDGRMVYSQSLRDCLIWETDTGKVLFRHNVELDDGDWRMPRARAELSDDGRHLALPNPSGSVVRFEAKLPELFSVGPYASAVFSPDGRRLVTRHRQPGMQERADPQDGKPTGENKLWDVEGGRLVCSLPDGRPSFPSGSTLVVTSLDESTLHVYDAEAGKERCVLPGRFGLLDRLEISRDGKRLISGSGGPTGSSPAPVVWDLTTGKELFRLEGHADSRVRTAFSRDGTRIASAASPGRGRLEIKLWAASGGELLSVEVDGPRFGTLRFSDDGHRLMMRRARPVSAPKPEDLVLDATPRPGAK